MLATRMRMSTGADFYPYKTDQSCRFNDDDSAYLHWTPAGAGTEETFTFVTWIKRGNLNSIMQLFNAAAGNELQFTAANKLQFTTATATLLSTQVFRDVGSHLQIVLGVDTTQATAANRVSIEINGVAISAFDTETYPNLNEVTEFGKAAIHHISSNEGGTEEFDGYQAEVIYIDGLKVAASSFGQSKYGIWIPKRYTGSYGTNGFYLDFADSADLGNDVSGNSNDFTSSGLAANDQVEDSPTNNYCIISPLDHSAHTFSNGNLQADYIAAAWHTARCSMFVNSGKWYFESKLATDLANYFIGMTTNDKILVSRYLGDADGGISWGFFAGGAYSKYYNSTPTAYGTAVTAYDVMQVAVDMDAGKIWFGLNGTWFASGDPAAGTNEAYSSLTGTLAPACSNHTMSGAVMNFGQLGFAHTPPTGYKALCSNNISTPSIKDSSTGFDAVLYEGNATVRDITDLNFDISTGGLVWIKNRDAADEHKLINTVRGATKELSCDSQNVEGTDANGLTAFLSNGFSLGTGAAGYNDNNESFVAWCFRMGTKYGFDIQTYTGTGVAKAENHDLGGIPELMLVKNLDSAEYWIAYHHHALNKTDPETDYGYLNTNAAWGDSVDKWNDTAPTASVFTIGTNAQVNENTKNHIAYLWRSIPQFNKVFSYTGNGNADGTFVYCGFRPRYILIKRADAGNDWSLRDALRDPYNPATKRLQNTSSDEYDNVTQAIDILSNGFKIRNSDSQTNTNSGLYVGIAYAEQPGKWSNVR